MKKKTLGIILSLTLLISFIPYARALDGLTPQGAAQYSAVLENLLKKYPAQSQNASGTVYAGLRDMNSNGVPELLTIWYNNNDMTNLHLDVYTIKNEKAIKTGSSPIHGDNVLSRVYFAVSNGITYVASETSHSGYSEEFRFVDMYGKTEGAGYYYRPETSEAWNRISGDTQTVISKETYYKILKQYTDTGEHIADAWDWFYSMKHNASASIQSVRSQLASATGLQATASQAALTLDGHSLALTAYNIENSNYFKLRDLAAVLNGTAKQFAVGYQNGVITLTSGQAYTPAGGELTAGPSSASAKKSQATLQINGASVTLTAYEIAGNNYFKLRDLAAALDFGVVYNSATDAVELQSSTGYDANATVNTPEKTGTPAIADIFAATGEDQYAAMSAEQKRKLNVFLSNFSEAAFWSAGEAASFPAEAIIGFAFRHNFLNTQNVQYSADRYMLSADIVDKTALKYFGFAPPRASAGIYVLSGSNYSMPAADGEGLAFTIASSYAPAANGLYLVKFTVFDCGLDLPGAAVYGYTRQQAAASFGVLYEGVALVKPIDGAWTLAGYQPK